jgi:hypothetical protein
MKKILTTFFVWSLLLSVHGQGWMSQGARVSAMGNAGVTNVDAFAYHHNPGALGFLKKGSAGISYESRYALKALQSQGIAVAVPLKTGVISAGGQFYGNDAYRTTRAGLGYSMKLSENIAAGVQVNYMGLRLDPYYGVRHGISGELGLLAKINKKIKLGFSVVNLTRTKLSKFKDDRFSTLLRLGASYQIMEEFVLMAEIEQEVSYQTRLRAGVEYHPIDLLYIRAGVQGAPMDFSFGFGFQFNQFKLDIATQYDQLLGWSPAASFHFDFYDPTKK